MKSLIALLLAVSAFLVGSNVTISPTDTAYGAISGPDINSPYLNVNGVTTFYNRAAMKKATTTICAFKSPPATSTLTSFSAKFTVATDTASIVTMAQAASAFATTTLLGVQVGIASNAQISIVGSTTAVQNSSLANVFAPNQYFVVGMQGGVGTFSPTGFCQADFRQL